MNGSKDYLRDVFRGAGRRLTSQRRLVLQVLEESDKHLDAEELYDRAKARNPDISLATIYRALAVLKKMGLVEEHRLGEEHGHYEPVRGSPHYHFTCLSCDKVIEFDAPLVEQIKQELGAREGVRVVGVHLHLSGYCAGCQKNAGGQSTMSMDNVVPLSAMCAGEQGVVVALAGGRGMLGRMASLGFTPGAEITVVQNFGWGPLIALVRDARVALGRGEASKIRVRR
jgi:Fur family ferric uptake transcriptional regulator